MTVHIVINGRALCGRGDLDGAGEWVGLGEAEAATCEECARNWRKGLARNSSAWPTELYQEPAATRDRTVAERLATEIASLRQAVAALQKEVRALVQLVAEKRV
ncbi:MAG: hypothetical protein C0P79_012765 [Gammaproteobacteria bacterium]